MPSNITVHAIEQFIRRWEPNKTSEEAEEELDALLRTSKVVGKTRAGQSIVVSGHRPEVRLVMKERNVCVTVLPPGSLQTALSEYETELMEESQRSMEERQRSMEEVRAYEKQRIPSLQAEVEYLEREVEDLNEQRRTLGQQKIELLGQIRRLKNEIKELST